MQPPSRPVFARRLSRRGQRIDYARTNEHIVLAMWLETLFFCVSKRCLRMPLRCPCRQTLYRSHRCGRERADEELTARIKKQIRENASIRHVPERIVQVADIPRTKSGKIVELAVRSVVHGEAVTNIEALANPEALALFKDLPELQD